MNPVITKEEYDNLCKFENDVYFKFTASWCKPCKLIQPTLETLSQKYTICTVDVDTMTDLADELQIEQMPTILHYKNGMLYNSYSGSNTEKVQNLFL